MVSGVHHYHKRKRKVKKGAKTNVWVRFFDKIIYLVAISGPLITLPQVFKIWIEQDSSGVSIITWVGYFLGSFFWLAYGFIHKEKPIIVANLLWVVLTFLIILGVWRYG